MNISRALLIGAALIAVPATAWAQIPVGTRVGTGSVTPSGYDDGGRRDPFVSLVSKKASASSTPMANRVGSGLAILAIVDVAVKGTTKAGPKFTAILEAPDHRQYVAHAGDRLMDGVVKEIDADGVTFMDTEGSGLSKPHEVRKLLRPAGETIR